MARKLEDTGEKAEAAVDCKHYWVIETPVGRTSRGVCRFCGAERDFANYIPHDSWEDDTFRFERGRSHRKAEPEEVIAGL